MSMENNQVNLTMKKNSAMFLKQIETVDELTYEKIYEIQKVTKQIDLNNLIYYYKGKSAPPHPQNKEINKYINR